MKLKAEKLDTKSLDQIKIMREVANQTFGFIYSPILGREGTLGFYTITLDPKFYSNVFQFV